VGSEPVKSAVFHAESNDSAAAALVVHYQVKREVLHEEQALVLQRGPVQSVQHSVTRPVCCGGTPIRLATLAKLETLTTESSLIYFSFLRPREWKTVSLKLQDGFRSFATHVFNGVLVTEPVRTFNCIIRMPPPIIFRHITQRCIDAALCCDCVRPRGEKFGNTSCFQTLFNTTDSSSKPGAASTNNNSIELMIDYLVC